MSHRAREFSNDIFFILGPSVDDSTIGRFSNSVNNAIFSLVFLAEYSGNSFCFLFVFCFYSSRSFPCACVSRFAFSKVLKKVVRKLPFLKL